MHDVPTESAAAVAASWRTAFGYLAEHAPDGERVEHGPIVGTSAGVPVPVFNQLFISELPTAAELAAALRWARKRALPFQVTVADHLAGGVAAPLSEQGLASHGGTTPGMALHHLDGVPGPDEGLDRPLALEVATDASQLEAIAVLTADAYGLSLDMARRLVPRSLGATAGVRWLLGLAAGAPVACGLLVRTGDVAGVYNVAVASGARRRGYGTAVTRQLLCAGAGQGCGMAVLQATPMGLPVYERMGFERVVDFHHYS